VAAAHLADEFRFEGPVSHYDSAAAFLAGSGPFLDLIHPGWRLISGFADDREALFFYELELRAGGSLRVANQMLFSGQRITAESIVFDSKRLMGPGQDPLPSSDS
jgi:hypothetical protein